MQEETSSLRGALAPFAAKYIWWKTPDEAVTQPHRVMAQIMEMGDYEDVQTLDRLVGDQVLCEVLAHAEPGEFSAPSWAYWHIRLGLAPHDGLPPMPVRTFA